ncbi:pyrophosphatase [Burkholderia sp. USMB20]|uniref:pyrophosphatase n=1 Tax=Burkholderia sp. USMB20 TaxID=1571773 RepID=UPI001F25CD8A|nr:pyrophosphatase [Burkholderia sp. USMB20]
MAPAKKLHREREAYKGYEAAVEEEFGDALWYFAALARRLDVSLPMILSNATRNSGYTMTVAASDVATSPIVHISSALALRNLDDALLDLGHSAAALLALRENVSNGEHLLQNFAGSYLHALQAANITFSRVLHRNLTKASGRFLMPDISTLPTFDDTFDEEERLPAHFEIVIKQRRNGQSCLQWNGVFIGDPLTDNIEDRDGYRFHDVFHFAHAAILHWSPTFRALIKHKRKSVSSIDEAQDGGRAIVVEEGLTAWLYSRAKSLDFFEGQTGVSFDLLKTIGEFVRGYEVEACPLKLWEDAILQGYAVFRKVVTSSGGVVIGDRASRKLTFRRLDEID